MKIEKEELDLIVDQQMEMNNMVPISPSRKKINDAYN